MDAILEKFNKLVKSWMYGESFDSSTWRTVIHNAEKVIQLRNKAGSLAHCAVFIFCGSCCFAVLFLEVFSTIGLADQLSEARVKPGYADEVLRRRAALRSFLCRNGVLSTERFLQSMTAGITIAESAADIIPEGIRRQRLLYNDFQHTNRLVDAPREEITPIFLTGGEEHFYIDDFNKSVRKLKFSEICSGVGFASRNDGRKRASKEV